MPQSRRFAGVTASLAAVSLFLTGCGTAAESEEPAQEATTDLFTVQRVVDGDTIEVEQQGVKTTVRLLNIDTPETKHPNKNVECLGPEATELTESLLEPGDQVSLEYDIEREDRYGRTLAGVFEDDVLINAEIARAGLGVPMAMDPNFKFYDRVKDAFDEAATAEAGFFDPTIDCTIPAQAEAAATPEDAQEVLDELSDAGTEFVWIGELRGHPDISVHTRAMRGLSAQDDADEKAGSAGQKSSTAEEPSSSDDSSAANDRDGDGRVSEGNNSPEVDADVPEDLPDVDAYIPEDLPKSMNDYFGSPDVSVPVAPDPVPAPAPAPQPAPAPAPAPKPVPVPAPAPAPKQDDSSATSGGGAYPGYTGPRCYAPGGKTWSPC